MELLPCVHHRGSARRRASWRGTEHPATTGGRGYPHDSRYRSCTSWKRPDQISTNRAGLSTAAPAGTRSRPRARPAEPGARRPGSVRTFPVDDAARRRAVPDRRTRDRSTPAERRAVRQPRVQLRARSLRAAAPPRIAAAHHVVPHDVRPRNRDRAQDHAEPAVEPRLARARIQRARPPERKPERHDREIRRPQDIQTEQRQFRLARARVWWGTAGGQWLYATLPLEFSPRPCPRGRASFTFDATDCRPPRLTTASALVRRMMRQVRRVCAEGSLPGHSRSGSGFCPASPTTSSYGRRAAASSSVRSSRRS